MSMIEAQVHAREVRNRLRRPSNAVQDKPIDLRGLALHGVKGLKTKPIPKSPAILPNSYAVVATAPVQAPLLTYDQIAARIINVVASDYGIEPCDILSDSRVDVHVQPRHVTVYLMQKLMRVSVAEIGRRIKKHHTTALHSLEIVRLRMELDEGYHGKVFEVRDQLAKELAAGYFLR